MQADGEAVRLTASGLRKVAAKLDGQNKGIFGNYTEAWTQLVSAGMAIVQGNAKIAGYRNPEDLFEEDPQHKLLKTVVACRLKFLGGQ